MCVISFSGMEDQTLLDVKTLGQIIDSPYNLSQFKLEICSRARLHSLWTDQDHETLANLISTMKKLTLVHGEGISKSAREKELNAEYSRLSEIMLARIHVPDDQEITATAAT